MWGIKKEASMQWEIVLEFLKEKQRSLRWNISTGVANYQHLVNKVKSKKQKTHIWKS